MTTTTLARFRMPLAVMLTFQVLDLATTRAALQLGGAEANPLGALVLGLGGFAGLVAMKALVTAGAVRGTLKLVRMDKGAAALRAVCVVGIVYAAVVAWNTTALIGYTA